jgi:hypothetical protein
MITTEKKAGIGHNGGPRWGRPSSVPSDATAIIYRPARSATTSGRGRSREWVLRFERRTAPFIEPLMGWTGGDDTLTQVTIPFATSDAAIAFAEREGWRYSVVGA